MAAILNNFKSQVSSHTAINIVIFYSKQSNAYYDKHWQQEKEVKQKSVTIKKIVLDLHGVIVDSRMVVLFEYE